MKKNFLNNIFPLLAIILMILIQQKQLYINHNNIINENKNIISETYLNLEEAKSAASKLNKDILIIFETDWCGTCRKFKKDSVSKIDIELDDYIVCFLDVEKDKNIIDKYEVKSLPYYIVINKNGEIKKRGSGYKSKNLFIDWLFNRSFQN
jgi:thioredoxin-related protein